MNNKTGLLISLLVLGLMLIGGGIWWKINSSSGNTEFYPVISMEVTDRGASSQSNLYVNKDGAVIDIEIQDAQPDLNKQGFKIWKQSQLDQAEFDSLIQLFRDNIDSLKENYQGIDDGVQSGDLDTVLSINYLDMAKKITATGYLSGPQSQETYAGMPSPLDQICLTLARIGANTVEFARE